MLIKSYQPLTNCWDDPPSTPKEFPRWNHHQKSTPFDPKYLHLTHFLQVHFAAAIHMGKHGDPSDFWVKQPIVQPVLGYYAHMINPGENHAHLKLSSASLDLFLFWCVNVSESNNMNLDNWVWSRKKCSTINFNIGGPKMPPRCSTQMSIQRQLWSNSITTHALFCKAWSLRGGIPSLEIAAKFNKAGTHVLCISRPHQGY